jgi:hypothetical protein
VNAVKARTIIVQARTDEVYEGPIPEDDAKAISEAESLVEMAERAWEQHVRGKEVEAILRLAASDIEESDDSEPEAVPETTDDVPQADPEPEPEPENSSETPEFDMEALAQVEPWEDYNTERVPTILEALDMGLEADDNPKQLLAHVWAFEAAHKNRSRIINKLTEYAEDLQAKEKGGEEGPPIPEAEPTPEPEPSVEKEPEPEVDTEKLKETVEASKEVFHPGTGETEQVEEVAEKFVEEDKKRVEESESEGDGYDELLADVEERIRAERLHVPQQLPEERPELPFDMTTLSDRELQALYSAFTAYSYRSAYLLTVEEAKARRCREAADEIARYLLVNAKKYDEHDKAKTMTILEAEVESDENVKKWRARQRKHDSFAHFFRQERDSYNRCVDSLSRLETMRHNEFERSGGMRKRS